MHDGTEFIRNLALVLCVAAVTTVLFQKLRQPVVLGYLLAGLLIGPHVPVPLVADQHMVDTLAETGVILLMFSIGLEFSFRKLFRVARTAGVVAIVQVAVMVWLGYVTARLLGWTQSESIFTGAVIAISSTTIIAKAFDEQGVSKSLRELVFAVLVVEDLLGILLLATLTTITSGVGLSAADLAVTTGRLVGFLIGIVVVGLLVVPRAIRAVLRLKRPETTVITCVGVCFAVSLLAHAFGYSVALGAFLGGSLVAESGEAPQIEHLIQPVRDVFAAVFFVAVGMLIDPVLIARHWLAVVSLTAVVVVGKLFGVGLGAFLVGTGTRTAIQAGMSLAQIGEFSFIIASLGLTSGATGEFLYPVAVAVSAITTLLTPWLIRASGPVSIYVDRKLPAPLQTFVTLYGTWVARIRASQPGAERSQVRRGLRWFFVNAGILTAIVIGTALEMDNVAPWITQVTRVGDTLARTLVVAAAAAITAPFALGIFRSARTVAEGWAAAAVPRQGDGADLGAAPRRTVKLAVELGGLLVVGLALTAITQPFLPLLHGAVVLLVVLLVLGVLFWRSARNLEGHVRAGAEVMIEALARQSHGTEHGEEALDQVDALLPGIGKPAALRLEPGSSAIGRSLRELNLRGLTGATVLAIQRGTEGIVSPRAEEILAAGDVLALVGTAEALAAARELLSGQAPTAPQLRSSTA